MSLQYIPPAPTNMDVVIQTTSYTPPALNIQINFVTLVEPIPIVVPAFLLLP